MAVEEGQPAPQFTLQNSLGHKVSLSDFAGSKVLVYFYPKAFTPGCTTEACDFRDQHEAFAAAGYTILGVSPDPPEKLERFRREHGLPFQLLSDEDHTVAAAYGAWGKKKNYGREYEGLIRSTFAIAPDGTIAGKWSNVRAKGHVARMAGALT